MPAVPLVWYVAFCPRRRSRLGDVRSLAQAVDVVRSVARAAGADQLADRLVLAWRAAPPSETELQRLSLLQQRAFGSHGEEEYAITMLWTCALRSIMDEEEARSLPASRSAPAAPRPRRIPRRACSWDGVMISSGGLA